MRIAFNFLFILSLSTQALANQNANQDENRNCLEKRYVFDIGSGSTKSKGYLVDICQNKLIKNLGEVNKAVRYQQCISSSIDKSSITEECLTNGLRALKAIEQEYGIDCGEHKCKGVATAWARNAKNSSELLNTFKLHDIHINLISQKEEGELGFKTALSDPYLKGVDPDKLLIWDIGGGSFQLSVQDEHDEIHTYEGPWGLFNFVHQLKEDFSLKGINLTKEGFFNKDELKEILEYTSHELGKDIQKDKLIVEKLKTAKVVGIGRIMYMGIKYELDLTNPISKEEIKDLIYEFAGMTVSEAQKKYPKLPDHFAPLIQQALILVYGVMDGAGINKLEIIESTLTDHLVLDQSFWHGEVTVAQQSF
ncbi:hypothetical protein NF27_CG01690 [Candidatus Jidaibacter acanthamoeba]|uniref:Ppx/GppA phosphatase N-terminal domain-containing protein n=1 Tax=Candidatus Jidaibacter acanthamoebae TaxID=86105 RepID=A0A0C1QKG9_9RICK|nr:hypothetical protein [Candidatus Jidaibacter acanthamoeba]KIE05989.1 hypothetical protein NF27_CG01690 [Candidatus Jidaibacter acanthamoeba]